MNKIRVLIADDHNIVREGISMILAANEDIEVVGEAADGRETITRAEELRPDVILMDIAMPGLGGMEATLEIVKYHPESKVLVLTQYDDREYIHRFLRAGAAGYVLKKTVGHDLVAAIRAVAGGKSYIDPSVAETVIKGFIEHPEKDEDEDVYERLTDREKTVFKLIAEGYTSRQIADTLILSIKTVMTHRANIMEKMGLHNRTDLIRYAIRKGLIQADS